MYNHDQQKNFFWGALVGGTLATLTTLLFTTKKGQQFQRQIAEAYGSVEDDVKKAFSTSKEKVEEVVDSIENKTKDIAKHSK